MLKKKIKYTDYNGVEREEEFLFNLSKAEVTEMQMSSARGLDRVIAELIKAENTPEIIKLFKEIIIKSYGEKSADGKYFIKVDENGHSLGQKFAQTEAFSELFMELSQDSKAASNFMNGLMPSGIEISEEQQKAYLKELGIPEEMINNDENKTPEIIEATVEQKTE